MATQSLCIPRIRYAVVWLIACAAVWAPSVPAQQLNRPCAALSINGTGLIRPIDSSSFDVLQMNSSATPAFPATAGRYVHDATPGTFLGVLIQGEIAAAAMPVALGVALAPTACQPVGGDCLELDLQTLTLLVNGWDPSNPLNAAAFLGATGEWKLPVPGGLPDGVPTFHLQAAIASPCMPSGLRMTGTVSLRIRNDVLTLARNFVDAYLLAARELDYLPSLFHTSYLEDGLDAATVILEARSDADPLGPQMPLPVIVQGVGIDPDVQGSTVGPPGAVSSTGFWLEILEEDGASSCEAPFGSISRERGYGNHAVASGGSWRWAGNQRRVDIDVGLNFCENASVSPPGFQTYLSFRVEDETFHGGGMVAVSVFGPQMDSLQPSGLGGTPFLYATSSVSQTVPFPVITVTTEGSSAEMTIELGLPAHGTSRQPIVEGFGQVPDRYRFMITWANMTTSGPYWVTLRAAIDPVSDAMGIIGKCPGTLSTPIDATLLNPGTQSATVTVSAPIQYLPAASLASFGIWLGQGTGPPFTTSFSFDELLLDPAIPAPMIPLCVPGLPGGVSTHFLFSQDDIFGSSYCGRVTLML